MSLAQSSFGSGEGLARAVLELAQAVLVIHQDQLEDQTSPVCLGALVLFREAAVLEVFELSLEPGQLALQRPCLTFRPVRDQSSADWLDPKRQKDLQSSVGHA